MIKRHQNVAKQTENSHFYRRCRLQDKNNKWVNGYRLIISNLFNAYRTLNSKA